MPSPFPGMNPWLEGPAYWTDFHSGFLASLRAAINLVIPPPYFAALSTRVYAEVSDRNVEPDVDILTPVSGSPGGGTATLTQLETDLLVVTGPPPPAEEITEGFIEIRTTDGGNRLVTSIELLSLTNKTRGAAGHGLYRAKQRELLLAGVNLVEIDFLRGGVPTTQTNVRDLRRQAPRYVYHVAFTRPDDEFVTRARAIELAQRLPTIPIPLGPDVPAVGVDLQPAFDRAFDESLFSRRLNYRQPPVPPLTPDQQTWADAVLTAGGLS